MSKYFRDKRSPKPKNQAVSKVMSANKSKNTKPELMVRKFLREQGFSGYRLHRKDLPGRPDIAFLSKKVAIFVNGCYWHRCPNCQPSEPKTNSDFWKEKFAKNVERDERKLNVLNSLEWTVFTLWECQIKQHLNDKATLNDFINNLRKIFNSSRQ